MNNNPASTSPGNLEKEPGKGKFYVDIYVIPDRVCWWAEETIAGNERGGGFWHSGKLISLPGLNG